MRVLAGNCAQHGETRGLCTLNEVRTARLALHVLALLLHLVGIDCGVAMARARHIGGGLAFLSCVDPVAARAVHRLCKRHEALHGKWVTQESLLERVHVKHAEQEEEAVRVGRAPLLPLLGEGKCCSHAKHPAARL